VRETLLAARVRRNAASAGLGALCLCYFGFFSFAIPTVTDRFTLGDAIFNYTLRIGGIGLGLIAFASLTGRVLVLAMDGALSLVIGAALGLSTILMLSGGGFGDPNMLIYLLVGGMFVATGIRNVRDFFHGRSSFFRRDAEEAQVRTVPPVEDESRARVRTASVSDSPDRSLSTVPMVRAKPAPPNPGPIPAATREPPAEGFLAGFAKKKPPPAP
jgi:hypothetical protein